MIVIKLRFTRPNDLFFPRGRKEERGRRGPSGLKQSEKFRRETLVYLLKASYMPRDELQRRERGKRSKEKRRKREKIEKDRRRTV